MEDLSHNMHRRSALVKPHATFYHQICLPFSQVIWDVANRNQLSVRLRGASVWHLNPASWWPIEQVVIHMHSLDMCFGMLCGMSGTSAVLRL